MRCWVVWLVHRLEFDRFEHVVPTFTVGDNIITGTDFLLTVKPIQNAVLLHDIAAVRAKSPPGNSE